MTMDKSALFLIFLVVFYQMQCFYCIVDIESISCTMHDKNFSRIDLCDLRLTKENLPAIFVKVHLLQLPVTNCDIRLQLIYVSPVHSSTLVDTTWDGCKFLQNTKRYKLLLRFYSYISNSSNLNHTCPYNHDINIINAQPGRINVWPILQKGMFIAKVHFMIDKILRVSLDFNAKNS